MCLVHLNGQDPDIGYKAAYDLNTHGVAIVEVLSPKACNEIIKTLREDVMPFLKGRDTRGTNRGSFGAESSTYPSNVQPWRTLLRNPIIHSALNALRERNNLHDYQIDGVGVNSILVPLPGKHCTRIFRRKTPCLALHPLPSIFVLLTCSISTGHFALFLCLKETAFVNNLQG